MSNFRSLKKIIREWLYQENWSESQPLPQECENISPITLVQPLFACLPEGSSVTERSAFAMGRTVKKLYENSPEDAKNIIRRFMWHMNDESGNIGWGIPEAFGEVLLQCKPLYDTFNSVLLHYIYNAPLHQSSNYCDNAQIRLSCYTAIGKLMAFRKDFAEKALPIIKLSAETEEDPICKKVAASLVSRFILLHF